MIVRMVRDRRLEQAHLPIDAPFVAHPHVPSRVEPGLGAGTASPDPKAAEFAAVDLEAEGLEHQTGRVSRMGGMVSCILPLTADLAANRARGISPPSS
jgi:hypothetical protein